MTVLAIDLVIESAPESKAGSAALLSEVSSEFGYALGVALIGSIGALVYRRETAGALPADIPPDASAVARESLAGAGAAALELSEPLPAALIQPARHAFAGGMGVAALVSAVLLAGVAVGTVAMLRSVPPTGAASATPPDQLAAAGLTPIRPAATDARVLFARPGALGNNCISSRGLVSRDPSAFTSRCCRRAS